MTPRSQVLRTVGEGTGHDPSLQPAASAGSSENKQELAPGAGAGPDFVTDLTTSFFKGGF